MNNSSMQLLNILTIYRIFFYTYESNRDSFENEIKKISFEMLRNYFHKLNSLMGGVNSLTFDSGQTNSGKYLVENFFYVCVPLLKIYLFQII